MDLEDDVKEDTLTYKMKNTFIFRPDLSNGLTGNEIITTVHPLLMVSILCLSYQYILVFLRFFGFILIEYL